MKNSSRLFTSGALLLAVLLSGCASQPTETAVDFDEEVLRNTDQDLFFATEFPVASKEEALQRAAEARDEGEIDKTLFFYVKALKFDPADTNLLAQIGLVHEFQGNDQLAARAYSMALEVDPDFAAVREARGLLFLEHGEDERAKADLTEAAAIDPNRWQSHHGLALIADRASLHIAAIRHYDRAIALNPESGELYNNRGYSKLLGGDMEGAEADLIISAETYDYDRAKINLGTLYAERGEYGRAVHAVQQALPRHAALNKIAEVAIERADYSIAETMLKEAIKESPTYFPEAERNLSRLEQQVAVN